MLIIPILIGIYLFPMIGAKLAERSKNHIHVDLTRFYKGTADFQTRKEAALLSNASTSPFNWVRFEAWVQETADVQYCAGGFEGSPSFLVVLIV